MSRLLAALRKCPRCGSRRSEPCTETAKEYVTGRHQPYESTSGWIYGHRDVRIVSQRCLECGHEHHPRRRVLGTHKAPGAPDDRDHGGYATP